jgi:hypothetical protein
MPFQPMKPIGYLNNIGTPCHFWLNQMSFWLGYSFKNTFWLNVPFDTWLNRPSWSNWLIWKPLRNPIWNPKKLYFRPLTKSLSSFPHSQVDSYFQNLNLIGQILGTSVNTKHCQIGLFWDHPKGFESKYEKWACILHLEIWNSSYDPNNN